MRSGRLVQVKTRCVCEKLILDMVFNDKKMLLRNKPNLDVLYTIYRNSGHLRSILSMKRVEKCEPYT
jgi:hypothetical protein